MSNGQVYVFDKRKIDRQVEELNAQSNSGQPVSSVAFVTRNYQSSFKLSGLLVSQFDKLCFYELLSNGEYKYHPLLMESMNLF